MYVCMYVCMYLSIYLSIFTYHSVIRTYIVAYFSAAFFLVSEYYISTKFTISLSFMDNNNASFCFAYVFLHLVYLMDSLHLVVHNVFFIYIILFNAPSFIRAALLLLIRNSDEVSSFLCYGVLFKLTSLDFVLVLFDCSKN